MKITEEFFEWIYQVVEGKKYRGLLEMLYDEEFFSVMSLDDNRLIDGINLRYRFAEEANIPRVVIDKLFDRDVCSVLEMMVGLAMRIEDTIMGDDDFGNRTSMWFWTMVKSMGLYDQTNDNLDREYIRHTLSRFLNRDYEADGKGGLFTIRNAKKDMRDVEIWYQMCLFFDDIL